MKFQFHNLPHERALAAKVCSHILSPFSCCAARLYFIYFSFLINIHFVCFKKMKNVKRKEIFKNHRLFRFSSGGCGGDEGGTRAAQSSSHDPAISRGCFATPTLDDDERSEKKRKVFLHLMIFISFLLVPAHASG